MKPEELVEKAKELVGEGNIEQAKTFLEDHKDDLGQYADQAKELLGNVDAGDLLGKITGFFKK